MLCNVACKNPSCKASASFQESSQKYRRRSCRVKCCSWYFSSTWRLSSWLLSFITTSSFLLFFFPFCFALSRDRLPWPFRSGHQPFRHYWTCWDSGSGQPYLLRALRSAWDGRAHGEREVPRAACARQPLPVHRGASGRRRGPESAGRRPWAGEGRDWCARYRHQINLICLKID